MIIDSSAILAILFEEPDAERFEAAIADAWPRRMSAVALLEATMVVEGRGGAAAGSDLDAFLERARVEFVPVTPEHVSVARQAWRRFGKGNHPAALNFGDCFAYALCRRERRAAALQRRGLRPHRYRGGVNCKAANTSYCNAVSDPTAVGERKVP